LARAAKTCHGNLPVRLVANLELSFLIILAYGQLENEAERVNAPRRDPLKIKDSADIVSRGGKSSARSRVAPQ
jgi:hypothetical protein